MPVDIGLWRLDAGIQRLLPTGMPSEKRLEDLIETDPSVLGQPLLLIGRQVPTVHGKYVDLLALDGDGAIHVLELKRDKTPRDVVAQALDYGSWVQDLSHEDVLAIYAKYTSHKALEVAFEETFGVALPEELNTGHFLTVVASHLDAESERIVTGTSGDSLKQGSTQGTGRPCSLPRVRGPGYGTGRTAASYSATGQGTVK